MTSMTIEREPVLPVFMNPALMNEDDRWAAVVRRAPAADRLFCYSVRTTSVYCRPSCASRLPRRENVRFHRTCADAAKAGFRPCKRCRPNGPLPTERRTSTTADACRPVEAAA